MGTDEPRWPYRRVITRYEGSGTLTGSAEARPCTFELMQLATGRLVMACRLQAESPLSYDWIGKAVELLGETVAGEKVTTQGARVWAEQPMLDERGWATDLKLSCGKATVGEPEGAASLRYGLTNLKLEGNESYREDLPGGGFRGSRQSRFSLDGYEVVIRSTPQSKELLSEVMETRGIAVTAEAVVTADLGQRKEIDGLMDRLCSLLSLGLGRGIVWVYRKAVDAEGHVVESHHLSAVTKTWSEQGLVPNECIEAFVGASYPGFVAAYEPWGLKNAIRAYNDALLEGDYLEFRALKLVVVMEYLVKRYREQHRGQPPAGRRTLTRDRRGKFARSVAGICASLGLPMSDAELDLVREARNRLVHEAAFLKEESAPSVYEQWLFLVTLIGRILLAIVGYRGDWYDWRGASDGNGPRRTAASPGPAA